MAGKQRQKPEDFGVFVNCPFDDDYLKLLYAIVFTLRALGFEERCALASGDSSQNRFERICQMIEDSRLAIHDLSRVELDEHNNLPRFNMPLELGIFLGAKRFGNRIQKTKTCLILDAEPYRYQEYCSDISGVDIASHANTPHGAISAVRDWLQKETQRNLPYARRICDRFDECWHESEVVAKAGGVKDFDKDLSFLDVSLLLSRWLRANPIYDRDVTS